MTTWFYILRLRSGSLYAGATEDVERRYREHQSGEACRTTKIDPPEALLYREEFSDFSAARKREAQVKRWTRDKKMALIAGDTALLKQLSKRRK